MLTEREWEAVFRARCKAKRGETLSEEERRLIVRAFANDKARYAAMNDRIFAATAPFGSTTRKKEE